VKFYLGTTAKRQGRSEKKVIKSKKTGSKDHRLDLNEIHLKRQPQQWVS